MLSVYRNSENAICVQVNHLGLSGASGSSNELSPAFRFLSSGRIIDVLNVAVVSLDVRNFVTPLIMYAGAHLSSSWTIPSK